MIPTHRRMLVAGPILALCFANFALADLNVVRFAELNRITGENAGDRIGTSVVSVSDWNGDGTDDILTGAPGFGPERGKAYVYSGTSLNGGAPTVLASATGDNDGDRFGEVVRAVPDIDGDGLAEIAIGAPTTSVGGTVYIYRGGSSLGIADRLDVLEGNDPGDQFGYSIASGGDVDGDGDSTDLVIGIPRADMAHVYRLHPTNLTYDLHFVLEPPDVGHCICQYDGDGDPDDCDNDDPDCLVDFGRSVAIVGDIDNDGTDDVAVGAPDTFCPNSWLLCRASAQLPIEGIESFVKAGAFFVYFGEKNGAPGVFTWHEHGHASFTNNASNNPRFGNRIAAVGDWNGDGTPDIVAGAPFTHDLSSIDNSTCTSSGNGSGHVTVWCGLDAGSAAGSDNRGTLLFQFQEPSPNAWNNVGWSVGGGVDFDLDGLGDILIGAPGVLGQVFAIAGNDANPCTQAANTAIGNAILDAPRRHRQLKRAVVGHRLRRRQRRRSHWGRATRGLRSRPLRRCQWLRPRANHSLQVLPAWRCQRGRIRECLRRNLPVPLD